MTKIYLPKRGSGLTVGKQVGYGTLIGFTLIFCLGLYKYFEIKEAIAEGSKMGPPPEPVATLVLKKQTWSKEIRTSGRIEATNGALIKAETSGRVDGINFEDGSLVKKGDLLLTLDHEVEKAEYNAALAKSDLAKKTLSRQEQLFTLKAISQEEYDTAKLNYQSLESAAKSLKARLDKKEVRAPFSGTIGVRRINVGQYVNEGDALFQLTDDENTYLSFSLGDNDSKLVEKGNTVVFYPSGTDNPYSGTIVGIDPNFSLETGTRLVKAKLNPTDGSKVVVGTFGKVIITLNNNIEAFAVPTSGVQYAPYGDSLFLVEYKTDEAGNKTPHALPIFIKILDRKGDYVAIGDGLKDGDEVVTNGAFKLQKGTKLIINNSSQDKSSLTPSPRNS